MANKYANLIGTNKIKDEYTKINIGFEKVETDINAVNSRVDTVDARVDTIITTPISGEAAAQEIVDARVSTVKSKTFATIDARFEESEQDLSTHLADYVSVKRFGVLGDGSDESANIQIAVNATKKLYFPNNDGEIYSFKNVTIDHDMIIIGDNTIFQPIHKTTTSNANESMFIASDIGFIKINGISVIGDNSIIEQSGDKYNTTSVFMFNTVEKVIIENCICKKLDSSYRLTSPTEWYDRRAMWLTFLDCEEVYMNNIDVTEMNGEEWIWRIYKNLTFSDGTTIISNSKFHDNVEGYSCFGLVGGKIHLIHNEFKNITFSGSMLNALGEYVYIKDNKGYNLAVNSVFDTCEGYNCKNEVVECINNYVENYADNDATGLQTHTKVCLVEGNYWICRNPIQTLMFPVGYADATVYYVDEDTIHTYDSIRIHSNEFYDTYAGVNAPEEIKTMFVIGRHNSATGSDISLDLFELKDNTVKSIRSDAYEPIYMYVTPNIMDVQGNHFKSLGRSGGSSVTLTVFRMLASDNANAIIKVQNNTFESENYNIEAPWTKIVVLFASSGTNAYKAYFSNNISNIVDVSVVSVLDPLYNAGILKSDNNNDGFKKALPSSIASASTITLPETGSFFNVNGTTTITNITASWTGRQVTIRSVNDMTITDGENLKLAGNFVTTTDDMITLVCLGTSWYEISRSVN